MFLAVLVFCKYVAAAVLEWRDACDTHSFDDVCTGRTGILEQSLIKFRAPHLECVRRAFAERIPKVEGAFLLAAVADSEIGA